MSHSADARLAPIAKRQAGAFSAAQAASVGFTRRMMDARVAAHAWIRLARGIFALASHPASRDQRCHASLLAHPLGALGGLSAATAYVLDEVPRHDRPQLVVPTSAHNGSTLATVHRSSLIRPRLVNGFRVNALPNTMLDIAAHHPAYLERAYESAVLRRRLSFDRTAEIAVKASIGRYRGAKVLRELLERHGSGHVPPQSELERLLYLPFERDGRIPGLTRQPKVNWGSGTEYVDGVIDAWGVVLEGDGRLWHARIAAIPNDRRRDHEAHRRGLIPIRFGWVELRDDPLGCIDLVIDTATSFGRVAA